MKDRVFCGRFTDTSRHRNDKRLVPLEDHLGFPRKDRHNGLFQKLLHALYDTPLHTLKSRTANGEGEFKVRPWGLILKVEP